MVHAVMITSMIRSLSVSSTSCMPVLNNADEINVDAPLPSEAAAWKASRDPYQRRRRALIDPQRAEVEILQKRWEVKCLDAWKNPGQDALWDRQWELLGLVWGGDLGEGQMEGWK